MIVGTAKLIVKTVLWIIFAIAVPSAACHAEEAAGGRHTQHAEGNCSFGELKEWVGKREKQILLCFQTGGSALIGKDNQFAAKVLQKADRFIVILSHKNQEGEFAIEDVVQLPKVASGKTILYGSCYTKFESGIVDAIAIAKHEKNKQFFIPTRSWIIDFGARKIRPNKGTKLTCVNESYGV